MENYILYLIPGIISFSIYRQINNSIPHEKYRFNSIIKYLTISVESYFWLLVIIIIFDSNIKISTSFSDFNILEIISGYELWIVFIGGIFAVTLPVISRFIYFKFILNIDTYEGSVAYTEFFMKYVFAYFDVQGNPFNVDDMKRKDIIKKVNNGELTMYSKPVKLKKSNIEIDVGQIELYYELPWDFKELLIDNISINKLDYGDLEKTYIDLENDIEIKIYKFKE